MDAQANATRLDRLYLPWQRRVFTALWLTYAGFYLCRVNISIALPGIMKEFDYSEARVGGLASAFFVVYGLGQLINGQLGDKWGARLMVPIGVFLSCALNASFGFANTLTAMAILWGANGYAQAMGWAPIVKTLANWCPTHRRGRMSALLATSYQVGSVASWLLAGYLADTYGWRCAFWVPAGIFSFFGVYMYWAVRNAPEEVGLPPVEAYAEGPPTHPAPVTKDEYLGFGFTLRRTLGNPRVLQVGLAYLFTSVVGYGFMLWTPLYLAQTYGVTASSAAARSVILPLMGALGVLCAGWASDRWFGSRRAPIITLMLAPAALLVALYPHIPLSRPGIGLAWLGLVGFAALGPQALMVSSVAMDLGTRKAASSAAGFIDAMGYVGATLTGIGTGWLVEHHGSWTLAFHSWAASVLISALLMGAMWRHKPKPSQYH